MFAYVKIGEKKNKLQRHQRFVLSQKNLRMGKSESGSEAHETMILLYF